MIHMGQVTDTIDFDDVGSLLRVKREALGLSARNLSAELGKSATYISKVESGDIRLSLAAFSDIALRLKLTNLETLLILQLEHRNAGAQSGQNSQPGAA